MDAGHQGGTVTDVYSGTGLGVQSQGCGADTLDAGHQGGTVTDVYSGTGLGVQSQGCGAVPWTLDIRGVQ